MMNNLPIEQGLRNQREYLNLVNRVIIFFPDEAVAKYGKDRVRHLAVLAVMQTLAYLDFTFFAERLESTETSFSELVFTALGHPTRTNLTSENAIAVQVETVTAGLFERAPGATNESPLRLSMSGYGHIAQLAAQYGYLC